VKLAGGGLQPTGTDALYRFESEKPVTVVRGKELQGPNGVAVDGEGPVMVTFGGGRVYRVAADGSLSELKGAGAGQLDGLVILPDGSLVISSWEKKTVYRYWPKGEREGETAALGATVESPADIGYDAHRERILVPSFNGNRVETRSIGP
jgi:sugar lactone lactonase YvrE